MTESADYGNRRVLVVDDQKEIHDDFREMLTPVLAESSARALAAAFVSEQEPRVLLPQFELLHAGSGAEACAIAKAGQESGRPVAVAYVDVRMPPGMDGVRTIRRLREVDPDVEVVVMTAYSDRPLPEIIRNVQPLHKVLYIRKPFSTEEIQQMTLALVDKWNVERELAEKQRQFAAGQHRLRAVLDATDDAIAMFDLGGCVLFANRAYEKLFGLTEAELKRLPAGDLAARLIGNFEQPKKWNDEGRIRLKNHTGPEDETAGQQSEYRVFYRSTGPVREGAHVTGSVVVYRDMTKEAETERAKAEVLRLRGELEATYSFEGIVGASPQMQRVYKLMQQAAESDITVLLEGESGTGKELVAKSLHFNSPRRSEPFLAINCAAIPETLIESELFGHEQGAFTGASRRRVGAFERACGGTILLDEIGDMPPALQAKLLRVLQEREIQRVGGAVMISVDVRVIAATNRDLEAAMKAGGFREDLYYRVTAFPIEIPSLRQRPEDIPLLADHFLNKHAQRAGKAMKGISTAATALLLQHDWPGNARELENAIERALLLETTQVLQVHNLPPHIARPDLSRDAGGSVLSLAETEQRALARALDSTGNNITQAARVLGINRVTLHRKLKRYGLSTQR
ncbi:MAG: sigma 54-interacting transcriptional regulator [Deltaproteobacteria bacterium]|nr:sigma 54-interacting transcriptional regulator [Deltaproteobacteria bacterium]